MTLTTHIIIAAAITKPLAAYHPILTFAAAVISHYLSDAIPHWDYSISSFQQKNGEKNPHLIRWPFGTKPFWQDLFYFALDGMLGVAILYALLRLQTREDLLFFAAIVIGSTLPDFLQGLYFTRYFDFLKPLQNFHDTIHTKIKLGPYPLIGIPFQILIVLAAFYLLRY